ncbi:hypothetical protein QC763_307615 [Podospora pseudopauciseta]|uniref:Uncharacterized protein n=2 Tax=Podospora TaxID=5144 RepID=A0ABR0HGQ9_9PEZI|nr:hypothetical protein QC763_307615 [Podospora pseudopauciseta]KAK4678436.1 hypothetical protein QC764_307615 [Podospora pseudoanserina]
MSTSVQLHPPALTSPDHPVVNSPLPQLLQTPHGLALLELQGAINLTQSESGELIQIGQLIM